MISYQARKGYGNVSSHEVKKAGDLQLCFNNRHSMLESKKVVWEYEVTGEERQVVEGEMAGGTNETQEYLEQAESVRRAVIKVRGKVARTKHTQWWLGLKVTLSCSLLIIITEISFQTPKDTERLESIISMIDKWSMAHSSLLVVVAFVQIYFLKSFFTETPTSVKLKMRT